jgi:hypothetical protein
MNLNIQSFLPDNFPPHSKVWVYQSSRLFTLSEALELEPMLEQFANNWKSHGDPVKGHANLLFGQFVILMADESATGVSGCSTDSSVRFIKELEQRFSVSLFDRQSIAFIINNKVQILPLSQVAYALQNGFIKEDSLFFNNVVLTRAELETNWIIPIKDSWLAKRIGLNKTTAQ